SIVSKARKSPSMTFTIFLPPASSYAFSKNDEIEVNNLPLLTESATSTKINPTEIEIIKLTSLFFFVVFSFSHSGKKYKHHKKRAVATVSTTNCDNDKSGARKT